MLWTASRREDGSKHKSAFKHPQEDLPRGVQGAKEHQEGTHEGGGGAGGRRGGVRRERVESECASRVLREKGVHSEGHCCCCCHAHVRLWREEEEGMYDNNLYRLLNSALDSKEEKEKKGIQEG